MCLSKRNPDTRENPRVHSGSIKWSILVLTQPSRARFLARLMAVLTPQVEGHSDIEIVTRTFDKNMDLGTNRQAMIDSAQGEYVSQCDDDDLVPADYVAKIYPLLDGIDYVGFRLQMFMDGVKQPPTFHSLRYPEWNGDENGWYRDLSHINPIRRDLCIQARMHGAAGEDSRWAQELRAKGVVKTEHFIDEVMYFYYFRSQKDDPIPAREFQPGPRIEPLQTVKCPKCGSGAVGLAGGMRNCNMCAFRW